MRRKLISFFVLSPTLWIAHAYATERAAVRLATGEFRVLEYMPRNGKAIFEGDIVLGDVAALSAAYKKYLETGLKPEAIVINGAQFRWPGLNVPFEVDGTVGGLDGVVNEAVNEWNLILSESIIHQPNGKLWIPHAAQPNFVRFVPGKPGESCQSAVGMQGGMQVISLVAGCDKGRIMHEMAHAMGLWHEQSRADREQYVTIVYANIRPEERYNFL